MTLGLNGLSGGCMTEHKSQMQLDGYVHSATAIWVGCTCRLCYAAFLVVVYKLSTESCNSNLNLTNYTVPLELP
jgi:hypothetical protein